MNNHIKKLFPLGTLLLFSLTMMHASVSAKACPRCDEINQLRAEAQSISNVDKDEDRQKASALIEKTKKLLGTHKLESSNQEDIEEFKRLVILVSDLLPLDPMTSVAEVLYSEMTSAEGKGRQNEYKKALSLIANSCKKEFLSSVISEYHCTHNLKDNETPDKCVKKPVFKYEDCVKRKSKK